MITEDETLPRRGRHRASPRALACRAGRPRPDRRRAPFRFLADGRCHAICCGGGRAYRGRAVPASPPAATVSVRRRLGPGPPECGGGRLPQHCAVQPRRRPCHVRFRLGDRRAGLRQRCQFSRPAITVAQRRAPFRFRLSGRPGAVAGSAAATAHAAPVRLQSARDRRASSCGMARRGVSAHSPCFGFGSVAGAGDLRRRGITGRAASSSSPAAAGHGFGFGLSFGDRRRLTTRPCGKQPQPPFHLRALLRLGDRRRADLRRRRSGRG